MKTITIGIPAYHAQNHICDAIASIKIQTKIKDISIIIAKDDPEDNYDFIKERYPDLDITILDCDKNTGPGLARQRALDACVTPWITFMDADDIFLTPFAIEVLLKSIDDNTIETWGVFLQEITDNPNVRVMRIENDNHPWVFGRCYKVNFLRKNNIRFSELRAMEDAEFNSKINLITKGTEFNIKKVDSEVYLWKVGSEHSITRIGIDENGIPQYNYDLCAVGAVDAAISAIKFSRDVNPFNGNVNKYTVEMMINCYFTYIECLSRKPVFKEQCFFNAKKFYFECFSEIESHISAKIFNDMYTSMFAQKAKDFIGIIPEITIFDFMNQIRNSQYGGEEEFKQIRSRLPEDIIKNDILTGVFTY